MLWWIAWGAWSAQAAEPVARALPVVEGARYHVDSWVTSPVALNLWLIENGQVRLGGFHLRMILDCAAHPERPRLVQCAVEDAALSLAGLVDSEPVQAGADEAVARLQGATLDLQFGPRGNLLSTDLNGVKRDLEREAANWELLYAMVDRAVAGFDAPTSEEPTLKVPRTRLAGVPWQQGAPSSSRIRCVAGADDSDTCSGTVSIRPRDQALVMTGTLDAEGRRAPDGGLLARAWFVDTEPTAGSLSLNSASNRYLQVGRLQRIDGPDPALGDTGPVTALPGWVGAWMAEREAAAAAAVVPDPGTHAWARLATGSGWRANHDPALDVEVAGGLRLAPGAWLGAHLIREGSSAFQQEWAAGSWTGWGLAASARWQPTGRWAPHLGLVAGGSARSVVESVEGSWTTLWTRGELGLSWQPARALQVELTSWASIDSRPAAFVREIHDPVELSRWRFGGSLALTSLLVGGDR